MSNEVSSENVSSIEIQRCAKAVTSGQVLAYPTETVWGLGADVGSLDAIENIFQLKGRAGTKAISLLVRDIQMAKAYAEVSENVERLMEIFWPGPLTFVLVAKASVPETIHGGSGHVGLRCSSHIFVRKLVEQLTRPITTTSCNRVGQPPALSKDELDWLPKSVARADWTAPSLGASRKGSTIVRILDGQMEVLREGDMNSEFVFKMGEKLGLFVTKAN